MLQPTFLSFYVKAYNENNVKIYPGSAFYFLLFIIAITFSVFILSNFKLRILEESRFLSSEIKIFTSIATQLLNHTGLGKYFIINICIYTSMPFLVVSLRLINSTCYQSKTNSYMQICMPGNLCFRGKYVSLIDSLFYDQYIVSKSGMFRNITSLPKCLFCTEQLMTPPARERHVELK